MLPRGRACRNNGDSMRTAAKCFFICLLFAGGCSTTLPSGSHVVTSHWKSYDEVKAAFDSIELNKTTRKNLTALDFDPVTQPNIAILSHLDLMQRFLVNPSVLLVDLDEGLQTCFKAKIACRAYLVDINNTNYQRYGNFLADILTFSRSTKQVGWKFNAIIVLVNDVVVYKLSGGTPSVDVDDLAVKPLGPVQNIGESMPIPIPH